MSTANKPERAIVVGAGLAGLSAAMHLVAQGVDVTVIESAADVGGLAAPLELDGIARDAGPTVLTMPEILDRPFNALGSSYADHFSLTRLDPAYRARYSDGTHIDVGTTIESTAASIENACGTAEAARFASYAADTHRLYDLVFEPFMASNFDSPLDLVGTDLLRLIARGGFRSLDHRVNTRLADERTRKLVSFQALYAGIAPHRARALYAVISYMDLIAGVFYPAGGMSSIPRAMADALRSAGGTVRTGQTVLRAVTSGDRVRGVVLRCGDFLRCDALVLAVDRTAALRLLGQSQRRKLTYSPSCVLIHTTGPAASRDDAHHTIEFGDAWRDTFAELTTRGETMSDPSLLVSRPWITDPALARGGDVGGYILAPTPNQDAGIDWSRDRDRVVDSAMQRLHDRGHDVAAHRIARVIDPTDWHERGLCAGTPFSLAHTMAQTGPFRPANRSRRFANVAFAGASTTPGVGVPTVLLSGELAARRLVGTP